MQVPVITMDRQEARQRLMAYESVRSCKDEDIENATAALRALEVGTKLIDVQSVLRDAPRDVKSRPVFAIARADRRWVSVSWRPYRKHINYFTSWRRPGPPESGLDLSFNMGESHEYKERASYLDGAPAKLTTVEGYAAVPLVPPDVLTARSRLRRYFVFWEVEQWADSWQGMRADRDPYLLQWLCGTLYGIVGEWELTELERAIMNGRNAEP